jgi:hypothetical protein
MIFLHKEASDILPHGGTELSPSGEAHKGAKRKKGKKTSDSSDHGGATP